MIEDFYKELCPFIPPREMANFYHQKSIDGFFPHLLIPLITLQRWQVWQEKSEQADPILPVSYHQTTGLKINRSNFHIPKSSSLVYDHRRRSYLNQLWTRHINYVEMHWNNKLENQPQSFPYKWKLCIPNPALVYDHRRKFDLNHSD